MIDISKITYEEFIELQKRFKSLEKEKKPSFKFSKIRDIDLNNLVDIEQDIDDNIFDKWFNYKSDIDDTLFFEKLIANNKQLINSYNEEDLKVNFIIPILNRVEFKSFKDKFRDFYELPLTYESDNFIFTGTTDFVVSKGLFKSKKPYFFIQEFKRSEDYGNPRPQLLAELISAVELNSEFMIKGAYIVGAIWNFVVLEKLGNNKYRYFASSNFNSTNIEDLKAIYKNLLFIKNEIIESIKKENKI